MPNPSDLRPPSKKTVFRFPCNNCGADYRYAPGTGTLICDFCGDTDRIAETDSQISSIQELDFRTAIENNLPSAEVEETRVVSCPNCAAQIEFIDGIHATECPFCATPIVTGTGINRHIKPRGVLPFALDEKTARSAMNQWLGRLWFAPNGIQEYARKGRKMQGIYVPYWTFDADTNSSYRGERGTVYYETRSVTRNGKRVQQQVAKVRWRAASGRVARFFDDVLVLASKSLPKKYTDALEPWDLSALEPYHPAYLAGFRAQGYDIELADAFTQARTHMDRIIARDVKFDIGGDRQRIHNIDTRIADVTFKHVLLPVWLAAYKYRGTTYRFVVNGRTGQVQGERPYSALKITLAIICGAVAAAAVGYLIAMNQ